MDVKHWFPTLIGAAEIKDTALLTDLVSLAKEVKRNFPATHDWHCDTYSSFGEFNYFNDPTALKSVEAVGQLVGEFATKFNAPTQRIECTEAWFNIASPGDYQEFHIHPDNHFSAVLYLKVPPNSGNIVFQSPLHGNMMRLPVDAQTEANFLSCSYRPTEGTVLCFPSSLYHMVERNKSSFERITAAFNFRITRESSND